MYTHNIKNQFHFNSIKKSRKKNNFNFKDLISMASAHPSSMPKLSKPSPSFRLRNPSLNTLRLRRIFDLFDRNSDGLITPSELSQALDHLGLSSDPSDVSSLLSPFVRPPGSAGLDFDAFQALHRSLGDALFGDFDQNDSAAELEPIREQEADMQEAFKVFDEDGDGFISARELQAVLAKLGLEEGENLDKINAMIGSVDCNKDGRVDFMEFKHMMRTVVVQGSS